MIVELLTRVCGGAPFPSMKRAFRVAELHEALPVAKPLGEIPVPMPAPPINRYQPVEAELFPATMPPSQKAARCLCRGYELLVKKKIFYDKFDSGQILIDVDGTPSIAEFQLSKRLLGKWHTDGWGAMESAMVLAVDVFSKLEDDPIETMEGRMILTACLTLACKNARESALSLLRQTVWRHAILAVIHHTLFQDVYDKLCRLEHTGPYLHDEIEKRETMLLCNAETSRLTRTPTFRVESLLVSWIDDYLEFEDDFVCAVTIRNLVSFYSVTILTGSDASLIKMAATAEFAVALALIAIQSMTLTSAKITEDVAVQMKKFVRDDEQLAHRIMKSVVERAPGPHYTAYVTDAKLNVACCRATQLLVYRRLSRKCRN